MSAIKRYLEDKCEEIAKETGLSWDEVLDYAMDLLSKAYGITEDQFWRNVEIHFRSKKADNDAICTGVIPVEYNHYKELVRKASEYDRIVKQVEDSMKASKCRSFSMTIDHNNVVLVSDTGKLKMDEFERGDDLNEQL